MLGTLRTLNVSLAPIPLTLFELILLVLGAVLLYYVYNVLFEPLNMVRKLEDVGYIADASYNKMEVAHLTQKRRVVGDVPPVYPNGWFGLFESFQLKRAEVKDISALGLHLAVFRDENDQVHAIDVYCPHLGANLAIGGKVTGSCLNCPFHGWRFRGEDGKCVHIPHSENIPECVKVKSWPVMEMNGWVYIWYHAEGIEPSWKPPEIIGFSRGKWSYGGRMEHMINAHVEEFSENGADVGHFACLHVWSRCWSFIKNRFKGSWQPFEPPMGHMAQVDVLLQLTVFGISIPLFDFGLHARQIGPGFVYVEFDCMFGKGLIIQNMLPVEPVMQKAVEDIYFERRVPTFIAKLYLYLIAVQVEKDIVIWNNKRYRDKPMFVKSEEDTLLSKHRRWYSQFYSEHSPRLDSIKKSLEW